MKREVTNIIRFVLEDCMPPVIRDLPLLNLLFSKLSRMDLVKCRQLRENIPQLTPQQISHFYSSYPRIQQNCDLSQKCIDRILENLSGTSVCDIGCGTGHLLSQIQNSVNFKEIVGVDFSKHAEWMSFKNIRFIDHDISNLPFEDQQFDTVICTHTLEHILDIRSAIKELRRIYKKKLIIVVPRERESAWSFNPHFYYFPYEYSFLKHLLPLPGNWKIERIGRDYLYTENR